MRLLAAALAVVAGASAPTPAPAFRNAALGTAIRNRRMPSLDGGTEPLLGSARANVFVFFRSGQDHSASALRQLAGLEEEMRGKPVRFVGIVSGDDSPEQVRAMIREAGARMPILLDRGDELYGELGVALHPTLGIADERHRLTGFQPFRKINFADAARGRIQLALGEIDEARLAAILDPPPAPVASGGRAHARVKLARVLLDAGKLDAAIESARAGLAIDPNLAEAHAVLAEALARAKRCEEADQEAEAARRLAPSQPLAAAHCTGR